MPSAVDYLPGDPAQHIFGKPEEKPARKHAPQPPKPSKTARSIGADIKLRIQEIDPIIDSLIKERDMLGKLDLILNQPKPKPRAKKGYGKPTKSAKK